MTTTTTARPVPAALTDPPAVPLPTPVIDNRPVYLAWAAAYAFGHGATALAGGDSPIVAMPGWLPPSLLLVAVAAAFALTIVRSGRDKKGMHGEAQRTAGLLGNAWLIGFAGLAALITGTAAAAGDQELHALLWPAGSTLVVGLLYTAAGAAYRDTVQYALGGYLAIAGSSAVFLGDVGSATVLATAGVAGYLAAAAVEPRRLATARDAGSAAAASSRTA